MTELRSKLTRKTAASVQYKPLVVTLYPHHLEIRQERVRQPYSITGMPSIAMLPSWKRIG
jgi:hypothetical protein